MALSPSASPATSPSASPTGAPAASPLASSATSPATSPAAAPATGRPPTTTPGTPRPPASLLVVGTGLIGTSIALAARRHGVTVTLADRDPAAVAAAVRQGAGRAARPGDASAELAVLAVPPDAVPQTLRDTQRRLPANAYTDVASVKTPVTVGARAAGCDLRSFVPGHPMAGSERSGAGAATADLFVGRAWALCPGPHTDRRAVDLTRGLIALCGATPVTVSGEAHDRAVAIVSHAPHAVASAVAAALQLAPVDDLRLAGPGVRDVTRVAAGDPHLWTQILANNAPQVAAVLHAIAGELSRVAAALAADPPDLPTVTAMLDRGWAGRRALEAATQQRDSPLPAAR